jgi:hypothetical protein
MLDDELKKANNWIRVENALFVDFVGGAARD